MLITKYLASVDVKIDPFNRGSKSARLFLSLLMKESARQANATKVNTSLFNKSDAKSSLKVSYKDGKVLDIGTESLRITDLVNHINAHSKALALKDQVS